MQSLSGWSPISWTRCISRPSYSIFQDTPENIYSFPPIALLFLGIGNFLGEELYFRGYLMKKSAFLGEANWTVNSVLFALYHVWQVQQTWPVNWTGFDVWTTHEAEEGSVGNGRISFFCEHVDGLRHFVKHHSEHA